MMLYMLYMVLYMIVEEGLRHTDIGDIPAQLHIYTYIHTHTYTQTHTHTQGRRHRDIPAQLQNPIAHGVAFKAYSI
jgi:hypothetical protein